MPVTDLNEIGPLLQTLGSTGVGGIVAAIVLWWKRIDDRRTMARERQYAVEVSNMLVRQENHSRDLIDVIKDNTTALTSLAERLEARENSRSRRQQ